MASTDMSKHFTWPELLAFVAPSIAGSIFTSIYGVVDGLFVSNFAGKTAFAAVNFIMPMIMILSTTGFMIGTGGSAIVGKTRGEGDEAAASRQFSLLVYFAFALGLALLALGLVITPHVAAAMGAEGQMLDDATLYGRLVLLSMPFFTLQVAFQSFFVTAGKPELGLRVTLAAGILNIVGDFVLVGLLDMGIVGAALATNASEVLGGLAPVIYFARKNDSALRLGRTQFDARVVGKAMVNGSSEMMTNVAVSVVSILYNMQLMHLAGENGVAAYGVVMYVSMIFSAIFMGYNMGASPLMSYQYGARNRIEMRNLFKKGLTFTIAGGVAMLVAAQALAWPISFLFTGYDEKLCELTVHAFRVQSFAFALMGFAMYGSALFTSLGNGKVSALISFLRTLVFEVAFVMLLPFVFGLDGVWVSWPAAEVVSLAVTTAFMVALGRNYGYIAEKGAPTGKGGGMGGPGLEGA